MATSTGGWKRHPSAPRHEVSSAPLAVWQPCARNWTSKTPRGGAARLRKTTGNVNPRVLQYPDAAVRRGVTVVRGRSFHIAHAIRYGTARRSEAVDEDHRTNRRRDTTWGRVVDLRRYEWEPAPSQTSIRSGSRQAVVVVVSSVRSRRGSYELLIGAAVAAVGSATEKTLTRALLSAFGREAAMMARRWAL
ncbi:hypothetical protein PCL_12269 [Purpureocillium lilacinum]|uniref:Uncharacterized protein n=1 Tax=Purpureocillium lilacinum TaxID=33203 RepID=A0A2U3E8R1_PURLI|nr:hypothetical protein PCL_12269 [Purpureocillium lilacinum]